eukprot:TRINITY_DN18288_c0_g1_i2.p2 TRINITY_DN18288_c0_g1~~TRINITY_DN18288_c0_g1_i2.p2  ORF type:complete len:216 (+),score=-15.96 TRINITY_DN18288_c0_g1_i2:127-774(+)
MLIYHCRYLNMVYLQKIDQKQATKNTPNTAFSTLHTSTPKIILKWLITKVEIIRNQQYNPKNNIIQTRFETSQPFKKAKFQLYHINVMTFFQLNSIVNFIPISPSILYQRTMNRNLYLLQLSKLYALTKLKPQAGKTQQQISKLNLCISHTQTLNEKLSKTFKYKQKKQQQYQLQYLFLKAQKIQQNLTKIGVQQRLAITNVAITSSLTRSKNPN